MTNKKTSTKSQAPNDKQKNKHQITNKITSTKSQKKQQAPNNKQNNKHQVSSIK